MSPCVHVAFRSVFINKEAFGKSSSKWRISKVFETFHHVGIAMGVKASNPVQA